MSLVVFPRQMSITVDGVPRVAALAYFYAAGTGTLIDVYTTSAESTKLTNPVESVSDGLFPAVFVNPSVNPTFKLVLKDADGLTIYSEDDLPALGFDASDIGAILYLRTAAEIAAAVTPTNYYIPSHASVGFLYVTRYGGAPNINNTTAMNSAALVAAQLAGGGIIFLPTKSEWPMNFVCTQDNLKIQMAGGRAGFDQYCIRPFNVASPPLTFGNGNALFYGCGLINCHVSGTVFGAQVTGGSPVAANSAPQALLLNGGVISFTTDNNCQIYSGMQTIAQIPSATQPITGHRIDGIVRNDVTNSAAARAIYCKRLAGNGYYTDNKFPCKVNSTGLGFAAEVDGTIDGINFIFSGYWDIKPGLGIRLINSEINAEIGAQLDPGTTGVVVINNAGAQVDPARFIQGYLRHGGQSIFFETGSVTVAMPAESDWFMYRARLQDAFLGVSAYMALATDPWNTTVSWALGGATGPVSLVGSDLYARKDIQVFGSNGSASGIISAAGGSGGLYLGALGSNQNVRLIPSGTGQVVCEGAYTRPSGDNTQDCGGAANRWKIVYAGTGAINTSDEDHKQDIEDVPQAWLDAWADVKWQRFKFKDAVASKGDGARWHLGLIAQRVDAAFKARGLDARAIGLLCYDEWPDQYEDLGKEIQTTFTDGDGNQKPITVRVPGGEMKLTRKAGHIWGMRYDEALAMECAYLRSKVG